MNRRNLIIGCSSAMAAMAGAQISGLSFANADTGSSDILVVVFLRGGWDAINVTPPIAGRDRAAYEAARPYLKIPVTGKNAALRLTDQFGLHPGLAPLMELYQGKQLAIIQAAGMPTTNTRSHFDAMRYMELGTPNHNNTTTGWISRYLQATSLLPGGLSLPGITIDTVTTSSFLGSPDAAAIRDPKNFLLNDDKLYRKRLLQLLSDMYRGNTWLHSAGQRTLATIRLVEKLKTEDYKPAVAYPQGELGERLKTLASLIKQSLRVQVATVDLGGWDTHQWQGDNGEGYFANLLQQLGGSLAAFYKDLAAANLTQKLNIVVMSEFGRRLAENASRGTDHGHGGAMLLLGGNVNGGKLYGKWPGLEPGQLYDRADLEATTDYRAVLAEVLKVRLKNDRLGMVFPGYGSGQPLGLVRG
jgi:uncharacterized protein (DUF1501 family)